MSPTPAPRAWRSLLAPGAATLVALAILVALGLWQIERKAWKEGLIARIAARAHGPAGAIPDESAWAAWRGEADEYRRVSLAGTFVHGDGVRVHGLAELRRGGGAAQGFYVITPLRLADGAFVLVNRGFVPTELADPARRAAGQVEGPVTVTGLMRIPETRGAFVPENDPARGVWFVRDAAAIARARGLARAAPFLVDADATPNPGGWPRGGQTQIVLKNDHLQYAITWFGLAASLVGVFAAFAWRRLRPSARELESQDAGHDEADAAEPHRIR